MNISMLGSARAASSNLNGLAETLRQAVVEVRSGDSGSGTGIIWGGAGLVVTNAHCIKRGAQLQVDAGGKWREAHALAYHPQHDLALIAAPSVSGPLLELRDPESLRPGELVFAQPVDEGDDAPVLRFARGAQIGELLVLDGVEPGGRGALAGEAVHPHPVGRQQVI